MLKELAGRPRKTIGDVVYVRVKRPMDEPAPESVVLKKGTIVVRGGLPLLTDIHVDRDVAVPLRDGTIIRADIYRPVGENQVPSVVSWSPYGKRNANEMLARTVDTKLSGLQKFEGPDPATWVARGYAIVNPDTRGAGLSEGRLLHWGSQEGRDGYDLTEWLAEQAWSNGKVGFAGNSWLAIAQWYIAAERPPHLGAIAPWEGFADVYRHSIAPGGVPRSLFHQIAAATFVGHGEGEDLSSTLDRSPLINDYWEDKVARLGQITVPTYVVSSYTNAIHTRGTIHAFNEIASKEKWLRIHNGYEWPDFYQQQDDLARFFDRFLKGIENGWESTPRVTMAVLDPGGTDTVNRPETAFPPERVTPLELHLDAAIGGLVGKAVDSEGSVRLAAGDGRSRVTFTHRFETETELIGFPILRAWMSVEGTDDADCYLQLDKLDEAGNVLPVILKGSPTSGKRGVVYEWGNGLLRLSHRSLSLGYTLSGIPQLAHTASEPLRSGEVVSTYIEIPPMAMRWRVGEQLRLSITGFDPQAPALPIEPKPPVVNTGIIIVHAGGRYQSVLELPTFQRDVSL